ncbi:MAG: PilW family protein, partial [Rhodoferax sp.]
MVSLTIGLLLMVVLISAYRAAAAAARNAEAIGRMNEDAQMALTILSQQLRMAGLNPSRSNRSAMAIGTNLRGNSVPQHNALTNAFALRGCDTKFANVSSATSTATLNCDHAADSTGPGSISIAYEADRYNTLATSDGVPTDCMGSGITPVSASYRQADNLGSLSVSIYEAENRFYIATSSTVPNPTLYCKGNASAYGQPLVENIEDLQLRYGVADPSVDSGNTTLSGDATIRWPRILGYLSAYGVDSDTSTLAGTPGSASRWNAVRAVRLCLVARSEMPLHDNAESAKYYDCNGILGTPPDLR